MGPPPLALGMVNEEGLYRRMQAKGMVGSFGVREEEPGSEVPVEVRQVVEEQVLVVIHELFLEGAIEAFGVGVHFWRAGVRPPVRDAAFLQTLLVEIDTPEGKNSPLVEGDYDEKLPIEILRPNAHVELLAALIFGSGTMFRANWRWREEDGREEKRSGKVSLQSY